MKKNITGLLGTLLLFSLGHANAQTADEIVNKYIDAIGGKEKLDQVKSVVIESSVNAMGNDNPNTVTILSGLGYKTETEFNGAQIVQCYTDKPGWMINPMAGSSAATPMPADVYNSGKDQIDPGGALFNYAAKGSKIELQGKEGNSYKIKLVTSDKIETIFFIDVNSYLLSKIVKKGNMMGQEVEISVKLGDYKKSEMGISFPWTTEMDFGGQFSMTASVKKLAVNKTVDPAIFAMPK